MKQWVNANKKVSETELSEEVDYNLPFRPNELSKCPLIKGLVKKGEHPGAGLLCKFAVLCSVIKQDFRTEKK